MSKKVHFTCKCGVEHTLYMDGDKLKHDVKEPVKPVKPKPDDVDANKAQRSFKDFLSGTGDFALDVEEVDDTPNPDDED